MKFPAPARGPGLAWPPLPSPGYIPPALLELCLAAEGEFLIAQEQLGQEGDRTLPRGGMSVPVRDWICPFGSCWPYILVEFLHPCVRWELNCTRAWPAQFGWRSFFLTEVKGTNPLL